MTVSLHKLTAGEGYTYLTRQVAAADSTERGYASLGDYYAAKGESPGVWWGAGLASLDVSGAVSEAQMKALFGRGLHPDADRMVAEQTARGVSRPAAVAATRLGSPYPVHEGNQAWRQGLAERYRAWNQVRGHRLTGPVPAEERARIRTELAREMFTTRHGRAPAHPGELSGFLSQASRPTSSAVAGFDLTFSPVKSVSALWAVAEPAVAEQVAAAHEAAVTAALEFIQDQAAYTRLGAGGVAQVRARGLIGARFTHRDSRAGDPDLHTHVAISNKVQTVDGRWLALDARMLYRVTVAASEFYNTQLEAEVTARVGGVFAPQPAAGGKRPVRELVGIDAGLTARWSARRQAITARTAELAARFAADHGRVPTAVESLRLAQQATLATRQPKHEPRSLAEQRTAWAEQAAQQLGGPGRVQAMLTAVTAPAPGRPVRLTGHLIARLAAKSVHVVSAGRARWREHHLLAEATRQARAAGLDPRLVNRAARTITDHALGRGRVIPIGPTGPDPGIPAEVRVPAGLRRPDGASVFRVAKSQLYTTAAVLAAEQRIVAAAGHTDARRIPAGQVHLAALEWSANHGGRTLNPAQTAMISDVATSRRRVQLALAPAGTGKTTVMGVLAAAWRGSGGSVLGLAPQASAAEELGQALTGVRTDTLDKLVHEINQPADRGRPDWVHAIDPDSLVIIDEAGLASTANLDAAIGYVTGRGGRVLLVGDDRQRAAVAAGGVLRDIDAAHGSATLTEVLRFTDPAEGKASLALRAGDPAATGFYTDKGRLHPVTADTAIDAVYEAWAADTAAGRDSIMMAPSLEQVAALNARARADRLATQATTGRPPGTELLMGNGEPVSAGDVVVTKQNNRALRLGGGTDFVQNNHRYTVTGVHPDGSLDVARIGRGGGSVRLPGWYVRAGHVRLGYAHTLAGCQGMTVGTPPGRGRPGREGTAHALLTAGMTGNEVYPGMTRAVSANHAWIDTGVGGGDPHTVITPAAVHPQSVAELFTAMIDRDGGQTSASTTARHAADPARQLGPACDAYDHAIRTGAETLLTATDIEQLTAAAEQTVPGVSQAPAWPTLRGRLALLAADGQDPITALSRVAAARELNTADDVAAVLDHRLDTTAGRATGPLPWVPSIPARLAEQPDWGLYLTARSELVSTLTAAITEQARGWTPDTAPAWATPYLADPELVADLAVWRAATSVDPTDRRPAGPRPARTATQRRHEKLTARCLRLTGNPDIAVRRWAATLAGLRIDLSGDDWWPVLAARLEAAEAAGHPVPALLARAAAAGPLPAEHPAAALWWRLAPHLPATTPSDPPRSAAGPVHPALLDPLRRVLGERAAQQIATDPLWPTLTNHAHTVATLHDVDPGALIGQAVELLAPTLAAVPVEQYTATLLAQLHTLTDSNPPDPDADQDVPPDPAEHDLTAPADWRPGDRQPIDEEAGAASVDPAAAPPPDQPPVDRADPQVPPDPVAGETAAPLPIPDPGRVLDRTRQAVAVAWEYYRQQSGRSWVPAYLTGRGLSGIDAGYASTGWTRLVDHLRQQGFNDGELLAAGLARTGQTGHLVDRFTNRLMLPIHDSTGQIVAFIGRTHPTNPNPGAPKYLNSPTTDLFTKADLPYGLTPHATSRLRDGADLVIVEGPLDAHAISVATSDLVPVAPLGTALTAGHLRTLNAVAPLTDRQILIALDNDPPGRAAARRAHTLLADIGIADPRTITLPPGADPAQLLADHGPAALAAALTDRKPLAELVIDHITDHCQARIHARTGDAGVEDRCHALNQAAPLIARLPEPDRNQQAERLATTLDLDPFTVLDTIQPHIPYDPGPHGPLDLPAPPLLLTQPPTVPHAAGQGLPGKLAGLRRAVDQISGTLATAAQDGDRYNRHDVLPPRRINERGPSIG